KFDRSSLLAFWPWLSPAQTPPATAPPPPAATTRLSRSSEMTVSTPRGSYSFDVETQDGIVRSESGSPQH
ncbi:UNVERIFIED_CONTAM: hypothetical protein GTU68_057231, partial [Idotea baltica]|nr:hypothetical protein [Idotea baltica]